MSGFTDQGVAPDCMAGVMGCTTEPTVQGLRRCFDSAQGGRTDEREVEIDAIAEGGAGLP